MYSIQFLRKSIVFSSTVAALSCFVVGGFIACGSSSSTPAGSTVSSTTYPSGLAFGSITQSATGFVPNHADEELSAPSTMAVASDDTIAEKKAKIDAVANGTTAASCQAVLPNFSSTVNSPSCYGPGLIFANHPNTTGGHSKDDDYADGGNNSDDYNLPTGDLGIWTATQGSESCSGAKINQLTQNIALKVDAAQLALAAAKCVMTANGVALPAAGASTDIATHLNTALSAGNSGLSVTSATFSREASDVGGQPVYKYELVFAQSGTTATISMRHSATDSTTYAGRIYGKFDSAGDDTAFSLGYSRAADALKFHLTTGRYGSGSDQLLSTGAFNLNSTGWSGDFNQTIVNFNSATSTGSLSFAWQAGAGDDSSRVFNAYVTGGTTGCAFFGYGGNFDKTTTTLPSNSITKFICNWAAPGNSHTGVSGKAQKQCFTVGGAASTSAITYAPVNSCDKAANQEGNSAGTDYFRYSTTEPTSRTTASDWTVYETTTVTNNLVTLASDTDFGGYTAPTAPTIGF